MIELRGFKKRRYMRRSPSALKRSEFLQISNVVPIQRVGMQKAHGEDKGLSSEPFFFERG
jgi:hypothetical protein